MSLTPAEIARSPAASHLLKMPLAACVLFTLIHGVGCRTTEAPAPTYAVRDSAGIQIVENVEPAWAEGKAWSVDTVPDLDISGQQDESLSRLSGPRTLADGGLVLFNGGECQVLFYSASGQRRGKAGRCGKGPEEFEPFVNLWPWRADSTLVVDQLIRVSLVSKDGTFGRIGPLRTSPEIPLPLIRGVLDNGALVVAGLRNPAGRESPGMESGQVTLGLLGNLDAAPQPVGTFSGPVFEYTDLGGERLGRGSLAFSSSTQFASGGDEVFVGFPDRYEIRVHGSDGFLRRIVRRASVPVRVEQRDIDWLMNRPLAEVEGAANQRLVRQAYRDLGHAEVMPAFGPPVWPGGSEGGPAMLVDEEANLWIFEHYRPGEYRNEWSVFAPSGVWQGQVALPQHLVPSEIGAAHVLGIWVDETGFVHVRRYRLTKP